MVLAVPEDGHGRKKMDGEPLIPKHGGYRKLKSFQIAQLIYDLTVRFCDRFIPFRSRTHDQMVQAARSGVQNIAEGSQASATSKKTELKLTNVARASLEELRLDYEDFLRQRALPQWDPRHPALLRLKARRCSTTEEVRAWIVEERAQWTALDEHGLSRTEVPGRPCPSNSSKPSSSTFAANAALSLLNLACYLLDRQISSLAGRFENEGGFTERLCRVRSQRRRPSL